MSNLYAFFRFIAFNISSLITVSVAVIAMVLVNFNYVTDAAFPNIIIGLLALISMSILIDSRRDTRELGKRVGQLETALTAHSSSLFVKKFDNAESAIEYLTYKTKTANLTIDQAAIDTQRTPTNKSRKDYVTARNQKIEKSQIKYRYIHSPVGRNISGIVKLKREKDPKNLYVNIAGDVEQKPIASMSFVIFDSQEVFVRAPYLSGHDPIYLSIDSPDIAALFKSYFDNIWDDSEALAVGS